jgi:hypothetical protein
MKVAPRASGTANVFASIRPPSFRGVGPELMKALGVFGQDGLVTALKETVVSKAPFKIRLDP